MAVDTVAKRFSMVNFGGDIMLLPNADGTLGAKDRLNLISLYSGIADAESGGGGSSGSTARRKRMAAILHAVKRRTR